MTDLFNPSTLRGNERVTENQGPPGPPGTGSATLYGTSPPSAFLGNVGDVYLQLDSNNVVIQASQKTGNLTWTPIGDINPVWITFNPTVTAGTGTITSFVSKTIRYRVIGKICFLNFNVWINAAGTGAGSIRIQLPFEPIAALGACASVFSNAAGGVGGCGFVEPTAVSLLGYPDVRVLKYDGTTLIGASVQTVGSITYEIV